MAEIKVGDIVTVMMEESFLWRQQGEVVSITNYNGPINLHTKYAKLRGKY
jgi:hypothetical protein